MGAGPLIRSTAYRWPDPVTGPYSLRLSVATIDGEPKIVGVELWGADPDEFRQKAQPIPPPSTDSAISSTTIRLPLHSLLRRVLDEFSHESDLIRNAPSASGALVRSVAGSQGRVDGAPVRKGRPPRYGHAHFADVANVYSEAISRGDYPVQAVMSRWTVNKRTAAGWVERARLKGLLPPTTCGRAAATKEDS